MLVNRSAPPATVTPVLVYDDVRAAVAWLESAFAFGYMLDALFSDGLYADLERLTQINHIVERVGPLASVGENNVQLRRIDIMVIMPSRDLSEIARHHTASLPRALRVLLRTMGALNSWRRPADELSAVPGQLHA